jgi:hypothetical protein
MNTRVLVGGVQEAVECFKDCLGCLERGKELFDSLRDFEAQSNASSEVVEAVQLDNCEKLFSVLKTPGIDAYKFGGLSKYPVLAERLEQFQFFRGQLIDILGIVLDAYIRLSDEEIEQIVFLVRKILEQLSYFVFFEYNFDLTLKSVVGDGELEINEAVENYCGRTKRKVEEVSGFVFDMFGQFRITLPSVELDDDTLDEFYNIAGLYSYPILENIDALDINVIRDIVDEKVSVEDVVSRITSSDLGTSGLENMKLF